MNQDQKKKNIDYWSSGSDSDLMAAIDIARLAKRNSYALFFIHLSIEKALKAYYVCTHTDFAPLTHNLLLLASKSKLVLDHHKQKLLSEINDFNLQTRYPDEIDELKKLATDSFTENYLKSGKEIQQWILDQLKKTC